MNSVRHVRRKRHNVRAGRERLEPLQRTVLAVVHHHDAADGKGLGEEELEEGRDRGGEEGVVGWGGCVETTWATPVRMKGR